MHCAARAEGPDQGSVEPEGTLNIGPGRAGYSPRDRKLSGLLDLGVDCAEDAGDVGRTRVRRRLGEQMASHPACRDAAPGQRCRIAV